MKTRTLMTFSEEQITALQGLMREDLQDNVSAYIAGLIGAEVRRRDQEKEKRGVGRPRKGDEPLDAAEDATDYTDDEPKNIPHFGRFVGVREYADIQAASAAFKSGL